MLIKTISFVLSFFLFIANCQAMEPEEDPGRGPIATRPLPKHLEYGIKYCKLAAGTGLAFSAEIERILTIGNRFPLFLYTLRVPIHISRGVAMGEDLETFVTDVVMSPPYTAPTLTKNLRVLHAILNHSFPMSYMFVHTYPDFVLKNRLPTDVSTLFLHSLLSPIALTNFVKGMEEENVGEQFTENERDLSLIVKALASVGKGLMIKQMVDQSLQNTGVDEDTRSWISNGAGLLSAGLTWTFDQNKILRCCHRLVENPFEMSLHLIQGALVTSVYWGMGLERTADIPFIDAMYVLEAATEALSINRHFPRVRSFVSRTMGWNSQEAH